MGKGSSLGKKANANLTVAADLTVEQRRCSRLQLLELASLQETHGVERVSKQPPRVVDEYV